MNALSLIWPKQPSQEAPIQVRDHSIKKLVCAGSIIAVAGIAIASMFLSNYIPVNLAHEVVVIAGVFGGLGALAFAKKINWIRLFFNANHLKEKEFFVQLMQRKRKFVESYFSHLVASGCISSAMKSQMIEHIEFQNAHPHATSPKFSKLLKCEEQFNNIVRMIDQGHAAKPGCVIKN